MHAEIGQKENETPFYCRRCKKNIDKALLEGFAVVCPDCRSIFHDLQSAGGN